MPTRVLAYFKNKTAHVEVDIDASNRVTRVRRVGAPGVTAVVARPDLSRSYTLGSDQAEITVPTTTANRVQLTFDAERNRYVGLTGEVRE